ncbi:nucleotidyltransferase family protein [Aestuariicella hydrocarbonica]|uniref:Nucleotidyltransferase family protein n=1 Tax=Pseudomaricurvus hydrocarbonicus TaxID=1470433 RepID=A0A9E5K0P0_9GAMM|nr:nucleotidyltransferase family protein [Aestuariicella hydrocarbonica]NHO66482.1 nucleotidyltransferase family protein [Aestuariicella hydrocarbonica]
MKAMILAAGLGKRMRPLTDETPKPLLPVGGKPLMVYHIERLRELGVREFLINVAYLGDKIEQALGDGSALGVSIHYSREDEPLETGGAILQALPWLGDDPFILVNGDVWTDYPFERLLDYPLPPDSLGCLVLVPNPRHNRQGDFVLLDGCVIHNTEVDQGYTFSGISLLRPELIGAYSERRQTFPLREALAEAIAQNRLNGELYEGQWWDIGTPERLRELDDLLS